MIPKVKILIILFLFPTLLPAQMSGKGKIITVQGDTIECYIQIEQRQFYDIVKYKRNKEDRFEKLPLSDLHRIIIKGKVYENLFFEKADVQDSKKYSCKICLCLVDGFMKLYKESLILFYYGGDGIAIARHKSSERDVYYVVKGNGNAEEVSSKFFVKQSQKTFIDFKVIVSSIKAKQLLYNDLVKIVENCNETYYIELLSE